MSSRLKVKVEKRKRRQERLRKRVREQRRRERILWAAAVESAKYEPMVVRGEELVMRAEVPGRVTWHPAELDFAPWWVRVWKWVKNFGAKIVRRGG